MKRLRHPIRAIREPFGTAGLIVAMIALVTALGGTALAASKLNSTQKKEVEKIAKKFAGKPGAPGANGTNGTSGSPGAKGADGTNGAPGTSPTGTNFNGSKTVGSVTCTEGGTEYKGATTNLVCNGKKGTTGFTETLPSEKTETGVWAVAPVAKATGFFNPQVPISFNIPLAALIEQPDECDKAGKPACLIHIFEGETIPAGCTGTLVGEPGEKQVTDLGAAPGNFCLHVARAEKLTAAQLTAFNPETASFDTVGKSGTVIVAELEEGAFAEGTWAVTAP